MHELPLHPLTITNLLLWPVEHVLLPVAEMGVDVEKVIKDPGFAQWLLYLLVATLILKEVGGVVLRVMGVSLPVKREITGTVRTTPEKLHADQAEVDQLKEDLQELREENRTQHSQAATAGTQRVMALSEVIDTRTGEIEHKLEGSMKELMLRMDAGFKDLSEKLAAVSVQGARHDATLPHLSERITALTDRYNEAVPSIHRRIDELTKAMAAKTR